MIGGGRRWWPGLVVAIYRLLQEASFGPDEIGQMTAAYEAALKQLRLTDRTDPVTEIIAKKIIEIVRSGEHDPARICAQTLEGLGTPPTD
jgi:hypothetical protein